MLSKFDWLRRSRTGAELIALLKLLREQKEKFDDLLAQQEPGTPFSALYALCQRCYIFPRMSPKRSYCQVCQKIIIRARKTTLISHRSILVWGFVNILPRKIRDGAYAGSRFYGGIFTPDAHHFLIVMHRRKLKSWLQDLIIYDTPDMKGLLQVFPTTGLLRDFNMGDFLCQVIPQEKMYQMRMLRLRFYAGPEAILNQREKEQKEIFNYEISEFMRLLEMAEVFRTLLDAREQALLAELLALQDPQETQFYWGRFLGQLNQKARDMLEAWEIRRWPENHIQLLYELTNYVVIQKSA